MHTSTPPQKIENIIESNGKKKNHREIDERNNLLDS